MVGSVLEVFDAQVRRGTGQMAPERVVRKAEPGEQGWTGVVWSDLQEDSADRVIAAQLQWLASAEGTGRESEWKLYSHDRPADLAERLTAALPKTLMITEIAAVPKDTPPSAGHPLRDGDRRGRCRPSLRGRRACLRDRRYPPPLTPAGLVTGQQ